eukprot:CAMPEP_0113591834 /NCGR_PEP_ID=MMETSP0015_2-20120614/37493_1 /TAXON_ID=2838 /ORGANISM="Odontella" /LENGTH=212 /DNA_ID=CAMNT_0000498267 /DNA_START=80 /DNA_END=718 /DNA_ORIENTATION=- /assembly_acc=CAM_ASM_000160
MATGKFLKAGSDGNSVLATGEEIISRSSRKAATWADWTHVDGKLRSRKYNNKCLVAADGASFVDCSSADADVEVVVSKYTLFTSGVKGVDTDSACQQFGSTLATIESEDDNNQAADLCDSSGDGVAILCWIGLSDANHEGSPTWLEDDSSPGYTNWNTKEMGDLNNCDKKDNVVISNNEFSHIGYGEWQYGNGNDDSILYPFICNGNLWPLN